MTPTTSDLWPLIHAYAACRVDCDRSKGAVPAEYLKLAESNLREALAALAVQVAPAAVWSAHDANFGMRFPEASDLTGGATDASPAAATSLEPVAWLIEHSDYSRGHAWWKGQHPRSEESGLEVWTSDPNAAIRYSRKADAELAMVSYGLYEPLHKATSHSWVDATPAPSPALPAPVGGPQLSTVPPVLKVLADWEDKFGSLAGILPEEWARLMPAVTDAAVIQSPRQARAELASRSPAVADGAE